MNILFVTENLGSGGAERQLTRLAAAFAARGDRAVVVTWVDRDFHGDFLRSHGVEHILLKPRGRVDRVLKLARIIRNTKADAIISYLPMANETAILARLISGRCCKLIVSERSFTKSWGRRTRFTYWLYRFADKVVANSNNEAQNIITHCPALKDKTLAVPNFVDLENFKPEVSHELSKPYRFVGVGRIIRTKNIDRLLEALSILKKQNIDVIVDWYGNVNEPAYLKELQGVASTLGVNDMFIFHGESADIASAYAQADFFVMPSLLEGYPNVLVEAMACGLPVAVSAVCEHPYIVSDDTNGYLFDPNSSQSIADAIKRLTELPRTRYEAISKHNREYVLANNTFNSFLTEYVNIIDK